MTLNIDELLAELDYTPLVLAPEPPGGDCPRPPEDDKELFKAKAKAAEIALEHGLVVTNPTEEQQAVDRAVFKGDIPPPPAAYTTPEMILHIGALINEYDHKVVQDAQQLRNYITNRLILETTDKNPTVRLRALENLGKISDVGLFTDKSEVTIKHHPAEELEIRLRARLERIIGSGSAVPVEKDPIDAEIITKPAVEAPVED